MNTEKNVVSKPTAANQEAEQELMSYLIWSMAHDQDPHESYDDPIVAFREQDHKKVA